MLELVLGLLAALFAGALVPVVFGTAMIIVEQGKPPRSSRAGLGRFFREWAAHVVLVLMMPFGLWSTRPRPGTRDAGHVPVLLVPGYVENRACFAFLATFLRRAGWRWVWAVNNRPFSSPIPVFAERLASAVLEMRRTTGAERVDLVGHSMGGVIAAYYVNALGGAEHVRRIVTLGTPWRGTRMWVFGTRREARDLRPDGDVIAAIHPPRVPATAIWSRWDHLVIPWEHALAEGVHGVEIQYLGHVEMLSSARVFRCVAEALAAPGAQDTQSKTEAVPA